MSRPAINVPVSPEAEQGVIGSLLHDNEQVWAIRAILSAEDFHDPKYASLYRAILNCLDHGQPADLVTLSSYFRGTVEGRLIDHTDIAAVMDAEFAGQRAGAYAAIVRDAAERRRITLAAQQAIETVKTPGGPIGATRLKAEADLMKSLASARCPRVRAAADEVDAMVAALDAPPSESQLLKTGYTDLDAKLGGLQPGAVYVIAGRPSMGKSSLATSLAQNVAVRRRLPVLIFSLEVPTRQVLSNIACAEARIANTDVRDHRLDSVMKAAYREALERIRSAPLFVDDTPILTANQIRSTIRIECARRRLGLVILDYLQLVGGDGHPDSREREVAEVCAALKQGAREGGVPIVLLSQLNRSAEARKDKKPILSDLRESGAIEQDADAVLLLHREDYYNPKAANTAAGSETTVCIAKNRQGPTGQVKLLFFPAWTRFESQAPPSIASPGWRRP